MGLGKSETLQLNSSFATCKNVKQCLLINITCNTLEYAQDVICPSESTNLKVLLITKHTHSYNVQSLLIIFRT